jgi:2-dehydro-3-deoxygluconokinase
LSIGVETERAMSDPARARSVVTLGESMLRLSTHARLEQAGELDVHVAGSESNVAVALAQLGWRATWLSALPETPTGRRVANELRACGVDISHVRWVERGRVGLFFVEHAEPPRNTTVWYDRAGSAAAALGPDDLDPAALAGVDYAVVSGITSGISPSARLLAQRFAAGARQQGAKVVVDVNFRPRLWDADEAAPAIAALVDAADVVVCSARDAEQLWSVDEPPRDAVVRLRDLHAREAELVVLTTGPAGAVASLSDGSLLEQHAYPATVVDRIGAGDAFVAGLIWGLAARDVGEALRAGALAAAIKCTLRGDHLLTTPAEFVRYLDHRNQQAVVR